MGQERRFRNSSRRFPSGRPARAAFGPAFLAAASCLSLIGPVPLHAFPVNQAGAEADDLPAPGDKVRCPDCDPQGRMACPDCGGKGELERDCKLCNGSGARPCPVCQKEEKGAGPGRVTCSYCGGKRTFGTAARPCPRCQGQGAVTCLTCSGKNVLPCRKKVPDKVCPRCRFVGKVTCETCSGETLISPALLAARTRAREKAASAPASGAQRGDGVEPRAGAMSEDAAPEKIDSAELEKRYAQLSEIHGHHLEIFSVDPRPELELTRSSAARLLKELRLGKEDELVNELEQLLDRLKNFRRRWGELRDLFSVELKTYVTVEEVWAGRKEARASTPPPSQLAEAGRWDQRLDLALRICEKNTQPLAQEEPDWLAKEAAEVRQLWETLKPQGEAALAALAAAERSEKKQAPPPPANAGKKPEPRPPRAPGLARRVGPVEAKAPEDPGDQPAPAPAALDERNQADRKPVAKVDRHEQKPAAKLRREERAADTASKPASRLFWTLAGFALACALFLFFQLKRKKAMVPEPSAPV